MKTVTKAPTAKIGSIIKVVFGNTSDTNGARIEEAVVVAETEAPIVGRKLMVVGPNGFGYDVMELEGHPGMHYCTSGFTFDEQWHSYIAQKAGVMKSEVKLWAEDDYSNFNCIMNIKSEAKLDEYIDACLNFNNPDSKPVEGEDYDMGEVAIDRVVLKLERGPDYTQLFMAPKSLVGDSASIDLPAAVEFINESVFALQPLYLEPEPTKYIDAIDDTHVSLVILDSGEIDDEVMRHVNHECVDLVYLGDSLEMVLGMSRRVFDQIVERGFTDGVVEDMPENLRIVQHRRPINIEA